MIRSYLMPYIMVCWFLNWCIKLRKKINDRYLKVVYDPSTVQKQSRVFSSNDSNLECYITMRPIATIQQNAMRKSAGQLLAYSSYKRQGELWQHTFPQELSSSSYPKETKQHILPTKYHKLEETWKGQLNQHTYILFKSKQQTSSK